MNEIKFRNKIIESGLKSIKKEKELVVRRGGKLGFEICKRLKNQEDFEKELNTRWEKEKELSNEIIVASYMHDKTKEMDIYREFRWATLQIEYVHQIMMYVWNFNKTKHESFLGSAKDGLTFVKILKANPNLLFD